MPSVGLLLAGAGHVASWHRAHTPIWEKSPGEQRKSTERMKKVLYSMIEVGRPWESEVCTSPEQGVS